MIAFGAKAKDPAPLSDSARIIPLTKKSFSPISIFAPIETSKSSAKRLSSQTPYATLCHQNRPLPLHPIQQW